MLIVKCWENEPWNRCLVSSQNALSVSHNCHNLYFFANVKGRVGYRYYWSPLLTVSVLALNVSFTVQSKRYWNNDSAYDANLGNDKVLSGQFNFTLSLTVVSRKSLSIGKHMILWACHLRVLNGIQAHYWLWSQNFNFFFICSHTLLLNEKWQLRMNVFCAFYKRKYSETHEELNLDDPC